MKTIPVHRASGGHAVEYQEQQRPPQKFTEMYTVLHAYNELAGKAGKYGAQRGYNNR